MSTNQNTKQDTRRIVCRFCGFDHSEHTRATINAWYEYEDDEGDWVEDFTRLEVEIEDLPNNKQRIRLKPGQNLPDGCNWLSCGWCGEGNDPSEGINSVYYIGDEVLRTLGELGYEWEEITELADSKLATEVTAK